MCVSKHILWNTKVANLEVQTCLVFAQTVTYSFMFRTHIYDAVELHSQNIKASSAPDYELPPGSSSSSKKPSTTTSKQDIKADTVKLQENPSYVPTDEFSWHLAIAIIKQHICNVAISVCICFYNIA